MTAEQIRLYALARTIVPPHVRIRTIAEPAGMLNTLYTLELAPPEGKRRWFGVHSKDIRRVDVDRLAIELKAAIDESPARRT